jgi:hypothetical protein
MSGNEFHPEAKIEIWDIAADRLVDDIQEALELLVPFPPIKDRSEPTHKPTVAFQTRAPLLKEGEGPT